MNIRMAAVAACALTLGGSPASANIITVVFEGIAAGIYFPVPLPAAPVTFGDKPATETYVFDTTKGSLTFDGNGGFTLDGGFVSSVISIESLLGFGRVGLSGTGGTPLETGRLDVHGQAVSASGHGSLPGLAMNAIVGGTGQWQAAPICSFSACGVFIASSVTITGDLPVASPVPLPFAGGGLPGLLGLGWWLWQRRRQVKVQVKVRATSMP